MCKFSSEFGKFVNDCANQINSDPEDTWKFRLDEQAASLVFVNSNKQQAFPFEGNVLVVKSKNGKTKNVYVSFAREGWLAIRSNAETVEVVRHGEVVFSSPKSEGWLSLVVFDVSDKLLAARSMAALEETRRERKVAEEIPAAQPTREELDKMTWQQLVALGRSRGVIKGSLKGITRVCVIDLLVPAVEPPATVASSAPVEVIPAPVVPSEPPTITVEEKVGEKKVVKIVNPNAPFNEGQLAQLKAKLGDVEVIPASVNFPFAKDGGLTGKAYESAMGYPDGEILWAPTGLGTGAAAVMATLHGRNGSRFPEIIVFGKPPSFDFLGTVNLDAVRLVARAMRYEEGTETTPVTGKIVVLNFSHPITDVQKPQIAGLLGVELTDIEFREGLSRQYTYTTADELATVVKQQVNDAKVSASDWQEQKIVVNLPAHSAGAMIALANIHGRMGYFPSALRIEKVGDAFAFTEVVKLDELRLRALTAVQKKASDARRASAAVVAKEDVDAAVSAIAALMRTAEEFKERPDWVVGSEIFPGADKLRWLKLEALRVLFENGVVVFNPDAEILKN